ncbi:MAG: motility associated factor glycosyltransferase family protein [Parachlamydiales bacterium]
MDPLQKNLQLLRCPGIAPLILATPAKRPPPEGDLSGWFNGLPAGESQALFIYGLGEGSICSLALDWLRGDTGRHLIVLEEDLGILRTFLEQPSTTPLLRKKRLHVVPLLDRDSLRAVVRPYALSDSRAFSHPACDQEMAERLRVAIYQVDAEAETELHTLFHFYENFYPNMKGMEGDLLAESLFGKFKGAPAILCGAGPSLEQALPWLEEAKRGALLFGGGSALTALGAARIAPHFGVGLSGNESERDRFERAHLTGVPLFYSPRICPAALTVWQGPRLATLSGDRQVCQWLSRSVGGTGALIQEGPSCVGLMLDLAYQMGCDPIIFVGVDLSLVEGREYAAGVEAPEPWDERVIELEGVQTTLKWAMEGAYLGEMVKARPGRRYLRIGGGLPIPGLARGERPAGDLALDVQQIVEGALRIQGVEKCLSQLRQSLEKVIALVESDLNPHLLQYELEQELAYQVLLARMWQARRTYLSRIYDTFLDVSPLLPEVQKARQEEVERERLQFLATSAKAHLQLLLCKIPATE